jgi:8-oxo-dGTP pyrophosphatase MutT (NUDIX family)
MCFMQRVTRSGDRWSGDVALPGGWAKEDEPSLREAAIRETHEEVGIRLDNRQHLGDVPALSISRYKNEAGVIGASVFHVGVTRPSFTLDPREVADAFWVDCAALYDPANRTAVHWSRSGPPLPRPAVQVEGRTIWGLTYRVLVRFSNLVFDGQSPLSPDPDT